MALKDLTYKPRTASVRIVLDDELRTRLEDARAALAEGRRVDVRAEQLGSNVPDLEQAVADAEAAADEAAVTFVFKAIPRTLMAELVAACPPSDEELAAIRNPLIEGVPQWSLQTFPPLLIGRSLVEPETTPEEVKEFWDEGEWSEAIWDKLWDTAWNKCNKAVSTRPTSGTVSVKTQDSGPLSTMPAPVAFPSPSSLAG
jgi:hypothetical protein